MTSSASTNAAYVCCMYAAAGNALVWCAADEGKRVKAFRAPKALGGPRNADAGCNSGQDNGMSLQYTLSTDGKGLKGGHAGLQVLGTKVFAATGEQTTGFTGGGVGACSDQCEHPGPPGWSVTADNVPVCCGRGRCEQQFMWHLQFETHQQHLMKVTDRSILGAGSSKGLAAHLHEYRPALVHSTEPAAAPSCC